MYVVSFGRWRVRRWPALFESRYETLEPTRVRLGRISYICADVAVFTGFVLLLVVGFLIALAVGTAG